MSTKIVHAVIFLRVRAIGSTGREYEHETAQIEMQRQACMTWAAHLGATVVREYAEYGGTGPIEQRPTLRLMLDELLALHDVRYVITTGLDRLARRAEDFASLSLDIEAAGAELVIAGQADNGVSRFGTSLAAMAAS